MVFCILLIDFFILKIRVLTLHTPLHTISIFGPPLSDLGPNVHDAPTRLKKEYGGGLNTLNVFLKLKVGVVLP